MSKDTDKSEDVLASCFGKCVLALLLMVAGTLLSGWVLSTLWTWFVVATFNVAPIGIARACGVALVVSFLTRQPYALKDECQDTTKMYSIAFLSPIFVLLFGWIIHFFVH